MFSNFAIVYHQKRKRLMELQFCLEQVCSQGRSTQHAVFAGQTPGGAMTHSCCGHRDRWGDQVGS